jgi:GTP-binding protein HflX
LVDGWIDEFDRAVPISAIQGAGLPALLTSIEQELYLGMVPIDVGLPYEAGRLLSLMHEHGRVEQTEHTETMIHVVGRVPRHLAAEFDAYRRPARRGRSQPRPRPG